MSWNEFYYTFIIQTKNSVFSKKERFKKVIPLKMKNKIDPSVFLHRERYIKKV